MKYLILTFLLPITLTTYSQTGLPASGVSAADNLIKSFMTSYSIPGLTFAMSKNGKIIYMRAFGYSDVAKTTPTQPYNSFRIASLSKQITSIAIMKLMQDGKLTMSSKVFGPGGLLEHHPVISTATITDSRIYNITVQQLLEHTAGWDRSVNCFPNPTSPYTRFFGGCDPINCPLYVTATLGLPNPVVETAYCKFMLQKGLNFDPGTKSAYSNMGYLFLGEIVKQLTGMSYEDYVKTAILHPLGLYDTHVGGNMLTEKKEREGEYVGGEGTNLSIYGDGTNKLWEYGGMDVTAMSAHGGWITTARDLLTLLSAVDGFNTKPDILTAPTVATMVQPSVADPGYAKGWSVNAYGNWWHTGEITGTASMQARASNGYSWVIIMNHTARNSTFWGAVDNLGWQVQTSVAWGANYDLMLVPTQNAAGISFTNVTPTTMTVNWTNGNGGMRMLVASETNPIGEFPLDGTDYAANPSFTAAAAINSNVKVLYNGTGNSVNLTGLTVGRTYNFRVIEYNKSAATGNYALYLLGSNPMVARVAGALPVKLTSFTGTVENNSILLKWATAQEINADRYIIQRSKDSRDFKDAGIVPAKGNSSLTSNYTFVDHFNDEFSIVPRIYYRLKMVDKDGTSEFSKVISLKNSSNPHFKISPNPVGNTVLIRGVGMNKVQLLDYSGRTLLSVKVNSDEVNLNTTSYSDGAYFIRIFDKNNLAHTERILIQK